MQIGLYWVRAREQAGRHQAFWTIGNCPDGKNIEPINPEMAGVRVEAVGPFIGSADELTGRTRRYLKPVWNPYRKPKPEELKL